MDLTPARQRLVFVVIVIALVGLTSYLIESRHSGAPAAAPSPSASTPSPAGTQGSGVPPSSVPAVTPVPTASGAEIYQWLPFTAADLSAASQTTLTFVKDYSTWSYTESVADYAAKLSPLVTTLELGTLKSGYSTAGVAGPRVADKQVSTGSGTIDSIRSFGTGPTSITFVITINEQVTSTQPASAQTSQYAVTVASSGGGPWQVTSTQPATTAPPQQYAVTVVSSGGAWQVNDLELSQLGNT
jgi:hypothetical protein